MAQATEYLPSKCNALSSNPSTTKKKEGGNSYEGKKGVPDNAISCHTTARRYEKR
jgi:hypothetical protein